MKFVFIRRADGTEFPVFSLAPQSHLELAQAWLTSTSEVVSAGFVEFHNDQAFVFGWSTTLQLSPRPGDAGTLGAFYRATVAAGRAAQTPPPTHRE